VCFTQANAQLLSQLALSEIRLLLKYFERAIFGLLIGHNKGVKKSSLLIQEGYRRTLQEQILKKNQEPTS